MDEKGLKDLVSKMQKGDKACFDTIFNDTQKMVFYNIYGITKSHEVSEDLMQEVYVIFLENYMNLRLDQSITGYFLTVSRNIAINYVKKYSRNTDLEKTEFLFEENDVYHTNEEELMNEIKNILNPKQFEIFVNHFYGELTFEEISKAKKIPLGTVIWYYNTGIKKLRKELKINENH